MTSLLITLWNILIGDLNSLFSWFCWFFNFRLFLTDLVFLSLSLTFFHQDIFHAIFYSFLTFLSNTTKFTLFKSPHRTQIWPNTLWIIISIYYSLLMSLNITISFCCIHWKFFKLRPIVSVCYFISNIRLNLLSKYWSILYLKWPKRTVRFIWIDSNPSRVSYSNESQAAWFLFFYIFILVNVVFSLLHSSPLFFRVRYVHCFSFLEHFQNTCICVCSGYMAITVHLNVRLFRGCS